MKGPVYDDSHTGPFIGCGNWSCLSPHNSGNLCATSRSREVGCYLDPVRSDVSSTPPPVELSRNRSLRSPQSGCPGWYRRIPSGRGGCLQVVGTVQSARGGAGQMVDPRLVADVLAEPLRLDAAQRLLVGRRTSIVAGSPCHRYVVAVLPTEAIGTVAPIKISRLLPLNRVSSPSLRVWMEAPLPPFRVSLPLLP